MERRAAFVKADCETCLLIAPLLAQLVADGVIHEVVSQDAEIPGLHADSFTYDDTLERSWRANIETVPTLLTLHDGDETARTVGWHRGPWEQMLGVSDLAPGLPEQRPGCGAKNVDPEMVDALEAMFGDVATTSRRITFGAAEDPVEAMFDRGWSDGLPLVPPTPERVERMLSGTNRDRAGIVAMIPPNLVEASVEKVAINAVMALSLIHI